MTDDVSLIINGKEYSTAQENTVLEACRENDQFVPTLCELEELDLPYGGCRLCLVEVETSRGTQITTSCDTPVQDGMKVNTETEEVAEDRRAALELLLSEHTGDCVAPCSLECPASLDVQGYIAHIANGRPQEAVKLIKEKTPLAVALGRACFAPCEEECRRDLVEDPMAIRQLKEYAAEIDIEDPWKPETGEDTGKTIGIVGGGPAGLTAAYFFRLEGHSVTIYDQMPELGGMMRYGIPNYRLPNDLLAQEIDWIMDLGIEARLETKMGEDITLDELRENHDSVLLATGAWESWEIPIPGHELEGVMGGTDFLVAHSSGEDVQIGDQVAVVGCGGCAMDTARVAKRMGAEVTVVYRRTEEQAPAPKDEIEEAKEEGIQFEFLVNPEEIHGKECVEGMTCAKMELGEPDESGRPKPIKIEGETEEIPCDTVLMSIGEAPEVELLEGEGLVVEDYTLKDHGKYRTNYEDVFAAGDASIGPSSIAESSGQGREAAYAINSYLKDELANYDPPEDFRLPFGYVHEDQKDEEDFAEEEQLPRIQMSKADPEQRIRSFEPIEHGYTEDQAVEEAIRCLECGCLDRFDCKLREYSDLYGARQYYYQGESFEREIDNSHPRVERDPNKCILCGSCVRTTEEVHGEGELQFIHRGFSTVVAPPFDQPLSNSESDLIGDLADSCPTGALEEVVGEEKPGPFEADEQVEVHCLGCGLTCPAKLELNQGRPIKLVPRNENPYGGHLCDLGKFDSLLNPQGRAKEIQIRRDGKWQNAEWGAISDLLAGKTVDVIPGKATTMEEARLLKQLADATGGQISTATPLDGTSDAGLDELLSAKVIYADQDAYRINPVLKSLVQAAKEGGAEIVSIPDQLPRKGGVAVLASKSDDLPRGSQIVASYEASGTGLKNMDLDHKLEGGEVLLLWDSPPDQATIPEESYDTIVHFLPDLGTLWNSADAAVPIRTWLEKTGTMVNVFNQEIEVTPCLDSDLQKNTDLLNSLLELVN
ncbi:MAG: FAD-dependent oxidoreductase [Candidatus Acetothermia bacterium]